MAESTLPRLVVVGSASTLQDSHYNGFVSRHVRFVSGLADRFETSVVVVQDEHQPVAPHPTLAGIAWREVQWRSPLSSSRADRARAIVSNLATRHGPDRGTPITDAVADAEPDVVLTLGPWLDADFEGVYRRFPTVHLAEEDVFRMSFFSPPSLHGRAFRNAEVISRRAHRGQPHHVVVISDSELAYAQRRFPGVPRVALPYTLDTRDWPVADTPATGSGVLVVGVLREERNSTGLAGLLNALREQGSQVPFTLVSDSGLHPDLIPFLDLPWVSHVPSSVPLRSQYRQAGLCVVPALEATGMKTTVLQAWSQGLPVAAYQGSAATYPQRFRAALSTAANPRQLAEQVVTLHEDPSRRHALAEHGLGLARSEFDEATNQEKLVSILGAAALARGQHQGGPA